MRQIRLFRPRFRWPYKPRQWLPGREEVEMFVMVNGTDYILTGRAGCGTRIAGFRTLDGPVYTRTHYVVGGPFGMKRVVVAGQAAGKTPHLAALESTVLGKLFPLVAHCAIQQYDDASPRQPGWITIRTLGAAWVVEAKDPDSCSKLTAVQPALDDALALLSVLMESPDAPWEHDPWLAKGKAKKKS